MSNTVINMNSAYTANYTDAEISENLDILRWIMKASVCVCLPKVKRVTKEMVALHAGHGAAHERYLQWLESHLHPSMSFTLENDSVYVSIPSSFETSVADRAKLREFEISLNELGMKFKLSERLLPGEVYSEGTHTWHYTDTSSTGSYRILILRHRALPAMTHAVAKIDTRSSNQPMEDANQICAALNSVK